MVRNYRKWDCSNKLDGIGCGLVFLARAEQVEEGQLATFTSGGEKTVWCPNCHKKPFGERMIELPEEVEDLAVTKYENHQVNFYDAVVLLERMRLLAGVGSHPEIEVLLSFVQEKIA